MLFLNVIQIEVKSLNIVKKEIPRSLRQAQEIDSE